MTARSHVIFNCDELIAACNAAKAAGNSLSKVFSIETSARSGPNGTNYMGLSAKTAGKQGRLMVRVVREKHVGQIHPFDDVEVARINTERGGGKYGIVKKRDRHPTLNVQKYRTQVATDSAGTPMGDLPGDDQKSPYYQVCELVDQFFRDTMTNRIAKKTIAVRDGADTPAGAIIVSNVKITPFCQCIVSQDSKTNPGMKLANPICRTNMKFDLDSGMPKKVTFFDFTKPYQDAKTGKRSFEPLLFNGHPVTAHNVHWIEPHSDISGIVCMNAVCASRMGLSIPAEFEVVIVDPPPVKTVGVEDVFEDDGVFGGDDVGVRGSNAVAPVAGPTPAPAPAPVAGPTPAPALAPVAEDDLAGVLNDLSVGNA